MLVFFYLFKFVCKFQVTLFRTIDDFKKLYEAINNGAKSILIVGGSFLGSELACALSRNSKSP